MKKPVVLAVMLVVVCASTISAQPQIGDCIRLKASSALGVPLHPGPGNNGVSGRLPDQSRANITAFDDDTKWYEISSDDGSGWISSRIARLLCNRRINR